MAGHEDAPTVSRAVCELAFPYPGAEQRCFDLRQWLGKFGVQQFMRDATKRFILDYQKSSQCAREDYTSGVAKGWDY
jgi:hypothetical protein